MRELQALVAPTPPQAVLVRGRAGLVIDKLSQVYEDLDLDEFVALMKRELRTAEQSPPPRRPFPRHETPLL